VGTKLSRRFALYVSGTQDQADLHVQTIASLFEQIGADRAVSKYGTSKGWRRNQLRTAMGFNVAAYGLDGATRGIKIEKYRPDLIIFDDIDSQDDSTVAVQKKIAAITRAIIPTGSSDCAILFLQNLIHEDGVVSQLVDGRAEFLLDREVPQQDPAVSGLLTEIVERPDGARVYRIVGGEATWAGQPLETCERQINDWGLKAFLREAQHEVKSVEGYFFETSRFEIVEEPPELLRVCLAWDLAATEGAGDHTVGVLIGLAESGVIYVLDVTRGQWASDKVRGLIKRNAERVHERFARYTIRLPQDPGQAGKDQADQLRRLLAAYQTVRVESVTGAKAVRARGWAEKVNLGNVRLVRGSWNAAFVEEHRKFREDETSEFDDQVDAAADAYNELEPPAEVSVSRRINPNRAYGRQLSRVGGSWFEADADED
jgi:predicted phage terminase large subunit-like protein